MFSAVSIQENHFTAISNGILLFHFLVRNSLSCLRLRFLENPKLNCDLRSYGFFMVRKTKNSKTNYLT